MDAGLLLLHVFLGLALVAHAGQKLFVFRLDGTAAYLGGLGFPNGRRLALVVIANEAVGGLLVAVGLLLPVGAALVASTMLVAARTDHRGKGWFITGPGSEYVVTNAVLAIVVVLTGGGRWTLDRALSLHLAGLRWTAATAVTAVVGAAAVLAVRRGPQAGVAGAQAESVERLA